MLPRSGSEECMFNCGLQESWAPEPDGSSSTLSSDNLIHTWTMKRLRRSHSNEAMSALLALESDSVYLLRATYSVARDGSACIFYSTGYVNA